MSTDSPNPTQSEHSMPNVESETARDCENTLVCVDDPNSGISVVAMIPESAAMADAQYLGLELRKSIVAAAAGDLLGGDGT